MEQVKIGIIGGSGLYDMAELKDRNEISLQTPFGNPSDCVSKPHPPLADVPGSCPDSLK